MSESKFLTDIEIAQAAQLEHIRTVAAKLGIAEDDMEMYGKHKAKLPLTLIDEEKIGKNNMVLVTAINPTPPGEGKTTTSIGLTEGLNKIGKQAMVVLREPSLGPVFGIKGGAAGGGYSQVVPMEDINLHFTGDFSAIEKANNLLSAMIDNNIQSKTRSIGIDPRTVAWKRVIDMNDRSLRNLVIGLGGKTGGIPREGGFNICAASEIMAILCMAEGFADLKERIGRIYVGDKFDGTPVYARDLNAQGAMTALLKDAVKPNLVQTLEGNPAIVHGGPFANIAQGTNTITGTKMGLSLSNYVVTEAGFGADLGAEKFIDIKCRAAGIAPKTVVLVATVRALKYHGGGDPKNLTSENLDALRKGMENMEKHLENIAAWGIPAVVAINRFVSDTDAELDMIRTRCKELGAEAALCEGWAKGGDGMTELAQAVVKSVEGFSGSLKFTYDLDLSIEEKVEAIAKKVYGADGVKFAPKAMTRLRKIKKLGLDGLPVCIAKTQKSISDNDKLLGRPTGFILNVRDIEFAAGAGFVVPITGSILRMPGLPATPSAEGMDIDDNGRITGLS